MRKNYLLRSFAWALIVALPFSFSNCSKSTNDSVTPASSSIVGSWKLTAYTVNPAYDIFGFGLPVTDVLAFFKSIPNDGGSDAVDCLTETKFHFLENGTATATQSSKCDASMEDAGPIGDNATWKLEGNKLTTVSDGDTETYTVESAGNTLKLKQEFQDDANGDGKAETYTVTLELVKV